MRAVSFSCSWGSPLLRPRDVPNHVNCNFQSKKGEKISPIFSSLFIKTLDLETDTDSLERMDPDPLTGVDEQDSIDTIIPGNGFYLAKAVRQILKNENVNFLFGHRINYNP